MKILDDTKLGADILSLRPISQDWFGKGKEEVQASAATKNRSVSILKYPNFALFVWSSCIGLFSFSFQRKKKKREKKNIPTIFPKTSYTLEFAFMPQTRDCQVNEILTSRQPEQIDKKKRKFHQFTASKSVYSARNEHSKNCWCLLKFWAPLNFMSYFGAYFF